MTGLIISMVSVIYVYCPANNRWGGLYDSGLKQIKICENLKEDEYVHYHEFGHYIWYEKMSDYERYKFKKMIEKESCVTEYACSSAEENFAENTREYLMRRKPKTPTQYFIRSILYKYNIK